MSRIRTIKPEFQTDPIMLRLSPYSCLLYIGLWGLADDYGCMADEPERIGLQLPVAVREHSVYDLLNELREWGRIERYRDSSGRSFIFIPHFADHQKIDRRGPAHFGTPDCWTAVDEEFTPTPLFVKTRRIPPNPAESQPIPPNPSLGKDQGKERDQGKGGETRVRAHAPDGANPPAQPAARIMELGTDAAGIVTPSRQGNANDAPAGDDGRDKKLPRRSPSGRSGAQASPEAYEFIGQFCAETGDAFTGDRRRQEALKADRLLHKAGSFDEAMAYVRWRIGAGQSPNLEFAANDYVPNWRLRTNGARASPVGKADIQARSRELLHAIATGGSEP